MRLCEGGKRKKKEKKKVQCVDIRKGIKIYKKGGGGGNGKQKACPHCTLKQVSPVSGRILLFHTTPSFIPTGST